MKVAQFRKFEFPVKQIDYVYISKESKDIQETKMPKTTKKTTQPQEETPKDTVTTIEPKELKEQKKFQFTYIQMKKVSELFEQKLGLKFWMNLSKEEQETEKATPTERDYYRLAYTVYNNFPLLNVVRYHPDRTRVPKGKAYSTINLKSCKCTMNAQNKIEFNEAEIKLIKETLNIDTQDK